MFDVCTTGDMAHWYDIQVFATHTSTWVHKNSSLLQWSMPLGQQGHMAMLGHIPKEKKSQGIMSGDLGGHSISCWSYPDARPIQRPGNTVFRHWQTSQWKWAGLAGIWMSVCFVTVALATVATCPEYVMQRPVLMLPPIAFELHHIFRLSS
jgi:hypothetical protein